MHLLIDLAIATMDGPDYGLITDGVIAIDGPRIAWVGHRGLLPESLASAPRTSFEGRLATPGLIDCHTHIVHGGNRANEFEMRLNGQPYEAIAKAGGGIVSTVRATRSASEDTLYQRAAKRVMALISEGICAIEIKSGYGLDRETELKMLRVARRIGSNLPVHVHTSFLGAHAVPDGMDPDSYINDVCIPALKAAHAEGLLDAVDGFCENIAFNADQIRRVFDAATSLGLPVKLHAEQLSHSGGSAIIGAYAGLSADHLEYATAEDAELLGKSGAVAVLLPGAFYTLHETKRPPVEAFRANRVPIAVATDWNPGSSPMGSVLLAMNMACTLFGLTPAEALAGATRNAARALGLQNTGRITEGARADIAIWDVEDPAELAYGIAVNPLYRRFFGGAF
ncbi:MULTISPECIES: imidazolonepropionase [unclassified Roseitalea]|uniref:imidazolonepropionase n=1 Tax=unclassified Roseitalea TaxID=2639107 RepID=UPI0027400025|nr:MULTISPECIES: imidazolonepropionase [unclassified Roseitalea]